MCLLHAFHDHNLRALQNASSIAGLLLTTEAVVTEKPEPKGGAPAMPGGGGGMGDMY
jgi:chaperonin GroEL